MATLSCWSLSEPILRIGSLLHTGLLKIFPYPCSVTWCRKKYTKETWYCKHDAEKHANLCEEELNIGLVLNRVTDAAVALPPGNSSDNFEEYNNSQEDDDWPGKDLSEKFKELRFAKPTHLLRNFKPIPPPLPNYLTETPEQPKPVESSSLKENVQETNELTYSVIVERAEQRMPMDRETFVTFRNPRAPIK